MNSKKQNTTDQKPEPTTRAAIRKQLLSMSLRHKLNLGLIAKKAKVPSTVEGLYQYIRSFAFLSARDIHDNAGKRVEAIEKLKSLHISLMRITTQEKTQQDIIDHLERISFKRLLEAGIFGEDFTPEMAEEQLINLIEMKYNEVNGIEEETE